MPAVVSPRSRPLGDLRPPLRPRPRPRRRRRRYVAAASRGDVAHARAFTFAFELPPPPQPPLPPPSPLPLPLSFLPSPSTPPPLPRSPTKTILVVVRSILFIYPPFLSTAPYTRLLGLPREFTWIFKYLLDASALVPPLPLLPFSSTYLSAFSCGTCLCTYRQR